jgi:hypothetical protein
VRQCLQNSLEKRKHCRAGKETSINAKPRSMGNRKHHRMKRTVLLSLAERYPWLKQDKTGHTEAR